METFTKRAVRGETYAISVPSGPSRASIAVMAFIELAALAGFIYGYFHGITWMIVVGGIVLLAKDVIEICTGVLIALFPLLAAVVLAIVMTPWYVGVFWSVAAFRIINAPSLIRDVLDPSRQMRTLRRIVDTAFQAHVTPDVAFVRLPYPCRRGGAFGLLLRLSVRGCGHERRPALRCKNDDQRAR